MIARHAHRCHAAAAAIAICAAIAASLASPARAPAASLLSPVCSVVSHVPGPLGIGCSSASRSLDAGRRLAAGNVGGAAAGLLGGAASGVASLGLSAIAAWAASGARFALDETATLIDTTTTPRLQAPWFEHVYWRLAGISVLLTLPCLFAAAVQSVIRADLALLTRAAFSYLPCAMLAVGVCAQLTALLLDATDGLCGLVAGVAGHTAPTFLARAGAAIVSLSLADHSPFLAFVIAVFTVAGAVMLWLELMMREAAVYVVVAMLPLAFAAFVWPARRVWALRAMELLAALILAKLAIVVVLTLGGAALSQSPTVAGFLAGLVLLVLGVFAPWAMLRMLPLTELASGSAGRLRAESPAFSIPERLMSDAVPRAHGWTDAVMDRLTPGTQQDLGGPRAAAEAVVTRMAADRPAADGASGPVPGAGGDAADPGGELPTPGTGGGEGLEGSPAGVDEPSVPKPTSMFDAADFSWRELPLSREAGWRAGPLCPGTPSAPLPDPQTSPTAETAPGPPPAQDPGDRAITDPGPRLDDHRPDVAPDEPDLSPDDGGPMAPRDDEAGDR